MLTTKKNGNTYREGKTENFQKEKLSQVVQIKISGMKDS